MVNILVYQSGLPFLVSFFSSFLFTYLIRIVAIKLRWISIPRKERWNTRYVALMGGIAVFASFVCTFLLFQPAEYVMVGAGGVLMFAAGFWDDRFELKPIYKFIIQFLAASILIFNGLTISSAWPFWLVIPMSYLWVIGITNAFNLLDNMDGLAAGIAVLVSVIFGIMSLKLGLLTVAVPCFILAGAAGGFLILNYNPAKIFMGDCGSMFIGYLMASFALMLEPALSKVSSLSTLPVLISISILPIFDTTLVTCMRLFKGRNPSRGGSDHSSHRLVFAGLPERGAVGTLYGISALFGLNVLLFYPQNIHLFYALFAIGLVGLTFFGLHISRLDIYDNDGLSFIESLLQRTPAYFKRKIKLALILTDIVLIITSLSLAHIIRFEGWSNHIEQAIIGILPGIIVLKVLILAGSGLYKSVWRYAGVPDMLRLFGAAAVGSLAAGIFAWTYNAGYLSISVFSIDFLLFLFFLSLSRFAFKGLHRLLSLPSNGEKNVLLYGAGDNGWLALTEIRQNRDLAWDVVGFVDDSPYKMNGNIQGVNVLGSYHEIATICDKNRIEEIIICISQLPGEKKEFIKEICDQLNLGCREFAPVFSSLYKHEEQPAHKKLRFQPVK